MTHCDANYLSRAAVLSESIVAQGHSCTIYLVCHDEITLTLARKLTIPGLILLELKDVIEFYPELKTAKHRRSHLEFLFCVTPFITRYILSRYDISDVLYIDADKYVYTDYRALFIRNTNKDIAISSHNFPDRLRKLESFGVFNVGLIYANQSTRATEIINWWSEKCIESTSISGIDSEVFGDQKYLDNFSSINDGVYVYDDLGVNAAPWNCFDTFRSEGTVFGNDSKTAIKTFHFSGLRFNRLIYIAGYGRYQSRLRHGIKNDLYSPYVDKLQHFEQIFQISRPTNITLKSILRGLLYCDIAFTRKTKSRMN